MLFFFVSICSISTYSFHVFQANCHDQGYTCIKAHLASFAIALSLWAAEALKASLWLVQARHIARPLVGLVFVPKEFKWVHGAYMRLSTFIHRFRQTSQPSGILVVGLEAIILYFGFGVGGPIGILTVASTGTIASIARNALYAQTERPDKPRNWHNAVANAGLASLLALFATTRVGLPHKTLLAAIAISSLAATLSDTMSHEIGVMFGGPPRLLTTLKRARPGDNGAVTILGSATGVVVSFGLALWSGVLGVVQMNQVGAIGLAGCIGNLIDSLLGATIEDRYSIGNNVINFCCVLSASIAAFFLLK